jgi:hypothetical protein
MLLQDERMDPRVRETGMIHYIGRQGPTTIHMFTKDNRVTKKRRM